MASAQSDASFETVVVIFAGGRALSKKIAVIGAGAKAAALVARASTLKQLGEGGIPELIVFEREHIGAAWSGHGAYTSGHLSLCTPGEKDVGFPYQEIHPRRIGQASVASALFSKFSWNAYQVATGKLADWVDRDRRYPTHSAWASYLKWVFDTAGQTVVAATVDHVKPNRGDWEVHYSIDGEAAMQSVDGVVLTGTGRARSIPLVGDIPPGRVLDAETFWSERNRVADVPEDSTVVVAGDGGAAGTIVAWLAERLRERSVHIISLSPMGTLFPRGDGYAERRWFTDPSDWQLLTREHRRKLMERTEAGVISLRLKQAIDSSKNVIFSRGRAESATWDVTELVIQTSYDGTAGAVIRADYLVNAIGFDAWSLFNLVKHPAAQRLASDPDARAGIEESVLPDLSLDRSAGLSRRLHIPGLAGLANGPGMGNLGCLGLMASSILDSY
ncbi:mycobactin lysine-N-oxygenase [Bosea sp. BE271]|uniref:SidA/IucD/PvdA family monooxygenase n=1 Tax=Bosea TaxID=85413 RepID=UPI002862232C|nr:MULTISPECIES: SidA/IucD/PvdA family monooxygenase [Bosea]MDR6827693.1 mycobactin lysine-N-oxygenase [Bosea robiniae]MDR6894613.1 mycobactin lysine-N-oxygenase [Bosea sp. BE109]MDR7137799.1 mycobactin lysine-N-oxygenase [Bosea sp. BE168]MDR7174498.1 mycobactin lysine-N-oxygenase [Bosea sp. BE271]